MTMQSHAQKVHPANPAEVIANVAYKVPSFHQSRRHKPCPRCTHNHAAREILPVYPSYLVQRSRIIVPVTISHTGPYDFLVDTGTRFTMLDPLLAAELHLKTQGSAEAVGVGFSTYGSFAYVDLLEAGSHSVENDPVEIWWSDGSGT